jgi:hypothetical protein
MRWRDPSAIIILQRGAESEADQDKTRWNQAGCGLWAAGAVDLILQASESASVWAECGGTAHHVSRCEFRMKLFRSKYFGGVMTLPPGKEKEVDGRSIERESIGGSIGYG